MRFIVILFLLTHPRRLLLLIVKDNLWIVDPIDGTTNFAHGIPLCGIIIAYASKGEVLYGCIYDPFRLTRSLISLLHSLSHSLFRNELFDAYKNEGAYLNGKSIRCCSTHELKQSVVCTGSPPNFSSLEACLRYSLFFNSFLLIRFHFRI